MLSDKGSSPPAFSKVRDINTSGFLSSKQSLAYSPNSPSHLLLSVAILFERLFAFKVFYETGCLFIPICNFSLIWLAYIVLFLLHHSFVNGYFKISSICLYNWFKIPVRLLFV